MPKITNKTSTKRALQILRKELTPLENWTQGAMVRGENCHCLLGKATHLTTDLDTPLPARDGVAFFRSEPEPRTEQKLHDLAWFYAGHGGFPGVAGRMMDQILDTMGRAPVGESPYGSLMELNDTGAEAWAHAKVLDLLDRTIAGA